MPPRPWFFPVSQLVLRKVREKLFSALWPIQSLPQLQSATVLGKQPQHVHQWMWPCSDKTLFTKASRRPHLGHWPQFANLCSTPRSSTEHERSPFEYVDVFDGLWESLDQMKILHFFPAGNNTICRSHAIIRRWAKTKSLELINQAVFLRQISLPGFNLVTFCFHKWGRRKKVWKTKVKKKKGKSDRATLTLQWGEGGYYLRYLWKPSSTQTF